MGVNIDKDPKLSPSLVDELGVESLLIRFPLWDIEKIDNYIEFVNSFKGKDIVINILQDRAHIEDKALLKRDIRVLFEKFSLHTDVELFQVGNAINRKKWGFFTIKEYLTFYKIVQDIRDEKFPHFKLIGSSVIDFEFHYTVRSLFNLYKIRYDIFSSLLYVDRRGSPENSQMGFNLQKKIKLLKAILKLSPKSTNRLFITETNWPIKDTAPYAPTSEKECVGFEDYAFYMVLYHIIALISGAKRVYWHQLIAPGYGLIDNREDIKRYPAFNAYKTMIELLKGATLIESSIDMDPKMVKFKNSSKTILVYWSDRDLMLKGTYDIYGDRFEGGRFCYKII
jgi:hypothetical protein